MFACAAYLISFVLMEPLGDSAMPWTGTPTCGCAIGAISTNGAYPFLLKPKVLLMAILVDDFPESNFLSIEILTLFYDFSCDGVILLEGSG